MEQKAVSKAAPHRREADAATQLKDSLIALGFAAKEVRRRAPAAGPNFQKVIFDDLDRRIDDVHQAVDRCMTKPELVVGRVVVQIETKILTA